MLCNVSFIATANLFIYHILTCAKTALPTAVSNSLLSSLFYLVIGRVCLVNVVQPKFGADWRVVVTKDTMVMGHWVICIRRFVSYCFAEQHFTDAAFRHWAADAARLSSFTLYIIVTI